MKIKQIEWKPAPLLGDTWDGDIAHGFQRYEIVKSIKYGQFHCSCNTGCGKYTIAIKHSLEEATEACQKHFENFMLKGIE